MREVLFSSHSFPGSQDVATMSLLDHMCWHNAEGSDALQEKMAKAGLVDRRPGIIGAPVCSTEMLHQCVSLECATVVRQSFEAQQAMRRLGSLA